MNLISLSIVMYCLTFHMKVSFVSTHRHFLEPCQNQSISKPIHVNNCTLSLANNATLTMLKSLMSDHNVKIILINFNVSADFASGFHKRTTELEPPDTYLYQQLRWQMVRFDVGQNLLLFFLKFKLLNLSRINIGFKEIDIDTQIEPSGCEANLSYSDVGYQIREILLDYTREYDGQGNEEISVCTQVIKKKQEIADFRTMCYTYKPKQILSCNYLNPKDGWENLIIFRDVISIVVLLFVPFLIPARLYNLKHNRYLYHLQQKLPVTLTMSESVLNQGNTQAFAFPILQYPNLKQSCLDIDTDYNRMVNAFYLDIDEDDLLPRGYAGADLPRVLYYKLFRCKCHSNKINSCLSSTLFPFCCRRLKRFTWHDCFNWFIRLLVLLLVPSPWLLRLFIYYKYEAKYITARADVATSLNLSLPFRGSLLNYIPPLHWTFLFVYTIYFMDVLFFGILYSDQMRPLGELVKTTFRDMKEYAKMENIVFNVDYLLWPLKTFGLPGLAVAPFYWLFAIPALLIWYCFYLIPMFRLILILLRDVCIYTTPCIFNYFSNNKVGHLLFKQRLPNFMTTLILLLSLVSASVLIAECVCYLVTVCFYAFILIILKANDTLAYVSLSFLVVFYLFETLNAVRQEYDSFHKKVTDKLIEEIVEISDNLSSLLPSQFTNIAYAAEKSVVQLNGKRGKGLVCCSPSMILFIDSQHHPHIPERFFYTICNLPYAGCPGSLTINYLRSLNKYFIILIFLGFVLIVVQTFSGLYNFSTTNQMLATLVGGFIPLFIRKLITISVPINEVDMETIAFKTHFTNAVKEFSEDWIINDLRIDFPEDHPLNVAKNISSNASSNPNLFMNIKICPDTKKYKETQL